MSKMQSGARSVAPIAFALMLALSICQPQGARCEDSNLQYATDSAQSTSYRLLKRSLCNTFGGCSGSKRSLPPPAAPTELKRQASPNVAAGSHIRRSPATTRSSSPDFEPTISNSNSIYQETAAPGGQSELISEVLDDLYEYLQANRRFRQPKLIVVMPDVRRTTSEPSANNPDDLRPISEQAI